MQAWQCGLDSSVTPLYVDPLFPKKGEKIAIRLQTGKTQALQRVRLVSFQLGRETHTELAMVRKARMEYMKVK